MKNTPQIIKLLMIIFRDGGPYQIETSPLIYYANQSTSFYIIGSSVIKELKKVIIL